MWVPGEPQLPFARKLGFSDEQTATGFTVLIRSPSQSLKPAKIASPPKSPRRTLLAREGGAGAGAAFASLSDDFPEWELIASGPATRGGAHATPKIVHHGFLQPHELTPPHRCRSVRHAKQGAMGVVYEMVIVGLPLLASRAVGAARSSSTNKNGVPETGNNS